LSVLRSGRTARTKRESSAAKKRSVAKWEEGKRRRRVVRAGEFSSLRKKGSVKYSGREDSRVLRRVLSTLTAVDHARRFEELVG
jgi:hypothetical protein